MRMMELSLLGQLSLQLKFLSLRKQALLLLALHRQVHSNLSRSSTSSKESSCSSSRKKSRLTRRYRSSRSLKTLKPST